MTRETFNEGFAALFNAYVYAQERTTKESEEVYWMMLREIPDAVFNDAVRHCLGSCKFFPTISELGEAAYPTIEERAPYNPFVYREPRKVGWQEQLKRIREGLPDVERKAIVGPNKEIGTDGTDDREPPEVRAARK